MIRIHLSRLLGERKMTQSEIAIATGIRSNTIGEYYYELVDRVNLEHVDLLCEALGCELWDLFERVPGQKEKPVSKRIRDIKNARRRI